MNKVFSQIKKYWLINLITFIASLMVGAGIFCIVFFTRARSIIDAIDGATLGGLIVLLFGLLMMVSHFGAFDIFVFGFKQLFSLLFSKDPKKNGNFTDYRDERTQKRDASSYNFIATILAGLLLSIAIIVLEIIYHLGQKIVTKLVYSILFSLLCVRLTLHVQRARVLLQL